MITMSRRGYSSVVARGKQILRGFLSFSTLGAHGACRGSSSSSTGLVKLKYHRSEALRPEIAAVYTTGSSSMPFSPCMTTELVSTVGCHAPAVHQLWRSGNRVAARSAVANASESPCASLTPCCLRLSAAPGHDFMRSVRSACAMSRCRRSV